MNVLLEYLQRLTTSVLPERNVVGPFTYIPEKTMDHANRWYITFGAILVSARALYAMFRLVPGAMMISLTLLLLMF